MLKELPSLLPQAVKHTIDRATLAKLHEIVLKQLGLTNMNHIRDRFEGQAYLDKFLMKAFAEIALHRILEEQALSPEELQEKNYKLNFKLREEIVELAVTDYDSYPLIPKGEYDFVAIVFVNIIYRDTLLLGFVKREDLEAKIDKQSLSPIQARSYLGILKDLSIVEPLGTFL